MKVLGEGGFSFVYLAQDEHSGVCTRWAAGTWARHLLIGDAETIRFEEDQVSNGRGRGQGGYEGGRGV